MVLDAETDELTKDDRIDLSHMPRYAQALRSRRAVVAEDARRDAQTAELGPYLVRHGIGSMLDSPVFRRGELVGVVCHEHVGEPRTFSKHDASFGASVADVVGLYLEQDDRQRTFRELLEARRELDRARVMESLGRMAAGVAHDVNHVLAGISLETELLRRRLDPSQAASLDRMAALVDQGARLVRGLVTLAREESPSTERIDLVETLRAMLPSLRALAGRDVTVSLALGDEAVPIDLARTRFEQVVTNLVVNARDAMLGGGTVSVRVARDAATSEARMCVEDSGVGMDEHVTSRMFEPFFTTKHAGHGTGLGLSTVYGIVAESRGTIDVDSAVGAGTRITIRWPLAAG